MPFLLSGGDQVKNASVVVTLTMTGACMPSGSPGSVLTKSGRLSAQPTAVQTLAVTLYVVCGDKLSMVISLWKLAET